MYTIRLIIVSLSLSGVVMVNQMFSISFNASLYPSSFSLVMVMVENSSFSKNRISIIFPIYINHFSNIKSSFDNIFVFSLGFYRWVFIIIIIIIKRFIIFFFFSILFLILYCSGY